MEDLKDDSLMPFGKYKGQKMIDVPASYLLWFYNEHIVGGSEINMTLTNKMLKRYIVDNLEVLKIESTKKR